jgi:hypothetical protein
MGPKDKDFYRDLKRCIKKRGGKQRRAHLKKQLTDNPEEAHMDEFDFGEYGSEKFNGMDGDATRIYRENRRSDHKTLPPERID